MTFRTCVFVFATCALCMTGCYRLRECVYRLPTAPAHLTEKDALDAATKTLVQHGRNPREWQLTRAGKSPSHAPDGTPDIFFDRFSFRPTEGRVHFTNREKFYTIQVRLEGDRVIAWRFKGL